MIAPDIAFIQQARVLTELAENYLTISPDLAIEVMSPSNNNDEMNRKIDLLFQHGTQLIWMIYPSTKSIDVYERLKLVTPTPCS